MSGKFVSLIEKSRVIESSRSRYSSHCQISHYKDLSDKKFLEKLIADYKDLNPVDSRGAAIAQAGVIYMATKMGEVLLHDTGPDNVMWIIQEFCDQVSLQFKDWRRRELVVYPLESLLMIIFLARCCGKVTAKEILEFYRARLLELVYLIPGLTECYNELSISTINRVFRGINPKQLNNFFVTYFTKVRRRITEQITYHSDRLKSKGIDVKDTYTFDGQEVVSTFRRGEDRRCKGGQIVSTYDSTNLQCLTYMVVDKKNQEKECIVKMLEQLGDKASGKVFMADALNTVAAVTNAINKAQGFYLMPIKKNGGNKELLDHVTAILNREHKHVVKESYQELNHGRIDEWHFEVLPAEKYLDKRIKNDHANLKTLVKYIHIRTPMRNGEALENTTTERYYISSLPFDETVVFQVKYSILDYWFIEAHHGILDNPRVFNQDDLQACNDNTIANNAGLNKMCLDFVSYIRQELSIKGKQKTPYSYNITMQKLNDLTTFELLEYFYDYWLDVVDESPLKTPTSNKLKLETIIEKYNSSSGSYKSFLF